MRVFAPAKVNLALHVLGQREDGYHLLDTLVAFADCGDGLSVAPAAGTRLRVTGPEAAGVPEGPENLVRQVADLLAPGQGFAIALDKQLPAASGIGGGSSDGAAMARALAALTGQAVAPDALLPLGADLPMCLSPRPCRATGIGEALQPVDLPPLPALLVNPRVAVPTGAVFGGLACKDNPPMSPPPSASDTGPDTGALLHWLAAQRNDLEAPARAQVPQIDIVLSRLAESGARLARMSGSGATCFGLYDSLDDAAKAAKTLRAAHPDWWLRATMLGDQRAAARPQLIRATT